MTSNLDLHTCNELRDYHDEDGDSMIVSRNGKAATYVRFWDSCRGEEMETIAPVFFCPYCGINLVQTEDKNNDRRNDNLA
jgi:hypothetical protein